MPKLKSQKGQQSLFDGEAPYLFAPNEQNSPESMAKFWIERHKIYLKRFHLKAKAPWTTDPVLSNYRFCNIYRELDTVSKWIIEKVIEPYAKNDNLWFMLAMSRIINWPDTLQAIMDAGAWPERRWDPDAVYAVMNDIRAQKRKVITGAYIINSVFPKGVNPPDRSKNYYIPFYGLDPLWKDRQSLRDAFRDNQAEAVDTLRQYQGWGAFMAYQVIVDLTYSRRWLGRASDIETFTSPGPGTTRGMNRLLFGGRKPQLRADQLNEPMIKARAEVNAAARAVVPAKWWTDDFKTGFTNLSAANFSNLCCEYDKYCRVISGEGEPRAGYKAR
jgi:hypothetical protein